MVEIKQRISGMTVLRWEARFSALAPAALPGARGGGQGEPSTYNLVVRVSAVGGGGQAGCKSFIDGFFWPLSSTLTSSNTEEKHFPCSVFPGMFKVNVQLSCHSIFIKICENGNITGNKPYLECGCLMDQQGLAHI